jgi:hypothetical protein
VTAQLTRFDVGEPPGELREKPCDRCLSDLLRIRLP